MGSTPGYLSDLISTYNISVPLRLFSNCFRFFRFYFRFLILTFAS